MGRLDNKVAIITGGGTGIGKAIGLAFAREGANVCFVGRTYVRVKETAEEARKYGPDALALSVDVTKMADLDKMVAETVKTFGKIDILVNNAGLGGVFPMIGALTITEPQWDASMDLYLKARFFGIQKVLPYMIDQGKGKIINITATTGFIREGMYDMAQDAVLSMTRALAVEFAEKRINVNCIGPGLIISERHGSMDTNAFATIPLGRAGQPEEIAAAAVYFASDESDFATGQILCLDGGLSAK